MRPLLVAPLLAVLLAANADAQRCHGMAELEIRIARGEALDLQEDNERYCDETIWRTLSLIPGLEAFNALEPARQLELVRATARQFELIDRLAALIEGAADDEERQRYFAALRGMEPLASLCPPSEREALARGDERSTMLLVAVVKEVDESLSRLLRAAAAGARAVEPGARVEKPAEAPGGGGAKTDPSQRSVEARPAPRVSVRRESRPAATVAPHAAKPQPGFFDRLFDGVVGGLASIGNGALNVLKTAAFGTLSIGSNVVEGVIEGGRSLARGDIFGGLATPLRIAGNFAWSAVLTGGYVAVAATEPFWRWFVDATTMDVQLVGTGDGRLRMFVLGGLPGHLAQRRGARAVAPAGHAIVTNDPSVIDDDETMGHEFFHNDQWIASVPFLRTWEFWQQATQHGQRGVYERPGTLEHAAEHEGPLAYPGGAVLMAAAPVIDLEMFEPEKSATAVQVGAKLKKPAAASGR